MSLSKELLGQLQQVSCRYLDKIEKALSPFVTLYGADAHAYYRIDSGGGLSYLSNFPEIAEFYFANEFYVDNPFLKHPSLIKSGALLSSAAEDPTFQETQVNIQQKFQLNNLLLIFEKEGDILHAHGFASSVMDANLNNIYLNELSQFKLFCKFFRQETADLQKKIIDSKVDFGKQIGPNFYERNSLIDKRLNSDTKQKFFHLINSRFNQLQLHTPLTLRELQSLKLYLKGKTAILIAKELNNSPRTIEHHLEKVKFKLSCSSKADIFAFANKLKSCGGELSMLLTDWHTGPKENTAI